MENLNNEMVKNEETLEVIIEEVEAAHKGLDFKSLALGTLIVATAVVAYKVTKPRIKKWYKNWREKQESEVVIENETEK